MKKEGVIFDCDGVLVPGRPVEERFWSYLRGHGIDISFPDWMIHYNGLQRNEIIHKLNEDFPRLKLASSFFRAAKATYQDYQQAFIDANGLVPFPKVRLLASWLRAQQIPIAVASNANTQRLTQRMQHGHYSAVFDHHVYSGCDHVERAKPWPDLVHFAAYRLGLRAERCVYVDDSILGGTAGLRAGAHTIGFPHECAEFPEIGEAMKRKGFNEVATSVEALKIRLAELLQIPLGEPA